LPLTPHEGEASKQTSLATQQGFDMGVDLSIYKYRESVPSVPGPFMNQSGGKAGAEAGYTYADESYGAFTRAEGRLSGGVVDYSSGSGILHNQPDTLAEARILEGKDFDLGSSDFSPYIGYGFRYLYNNLHNANGYLRESHYQYIPMGATDRFRLGDQARIAANIEYDLFMGGVQKSFRFENDPPAPALVTDEPNNSTTEVGVKLVRDFW
jgi:hypothetical protein